MFLFLIAALLVIAGIYEALKGEILFAIILIVLACLVGPGGYSVFH